MLNTNNIKPTPLQWEETGNRSNKSNTNNNKWKKTPTEANSGPLGLPLSVEGPFGEEPSSDPSGTGDGGWGGET